MKYKVDGFTMLKRQNCRTIDMFLLNLKATTGSAPKIFPCQPFSNMVNAHPIIYFIRRQRLYCRRTYPPEPWDNTTSLGPLTSNVVGYWMLALTMLEKVCINIKYLKCIDLPKNRFYEK